MSPDEGSRRPSSVHWVRRGMRGEDWRTVLAVAAGAAVGVGAVALYLGRNFVGRDRLEGGPPGPAHRPPRPPEGPERTPRGADR